MQTIYIYIYISAYILKSDIAIIAARMLHPKSNPKSVSQAVRPSVRSPVGLPVRPFARSPLSPFKRSGAQPKELHGRTGSASTQLQASRLPGQTHSHKPADQQDKLLHGRQTRQTGPWPKVLHAFQPGLAPRLVLALWIWLWIWPPTTTKHK